MGRRKRTCGCIRDPHRAPAHWGILIVLASSVWAWGSGTGSAADRAGPRAADPNGAGTYVSRPEYEALQKELAEVKVRLAAQEGSPTRNAAAGDANQTSPGPAAPAPPAVPTRWPWLGAGLTDTKLLITGDTSAAFFNPQGQPSTFAAEFNPFFLWQLDERLFFEGALALSLTGPDNTGEGSGTDAELDLANLSYRLTDWAVVGAGKFTVPFTVYHNHLDPSWINKLPFDPLIYGDGGIAPGTGVGAFVTGAVPLGDMEFNYAGFITNGPALITDDPDLAGSLNFDNFNDLNNNKALGFRLGFLPIPALEVGYSFEFSRPSPDGFETVHSRMHGLDLNYVAPLDPIYGQLTVRGAYMWSHLGTATYDPTGALGFGPLRFKNNRHGGYAEVAYRPTQVSDRFVRNFELVLRYDLLNIPADAPGGGYRQMWTPGIDYWITPRTVLKVAYSIARGPDTANVLALQFATGF